jgi:hypothetical protein
MMAVAIRRGVMRSNCMMVLRVHSEGEIWLLLKSNCPFTFNVQGIFIKQLSLTLLGNKEKILNWLFYLPSHAYPGTEISGAYCYQSASGNTLVRWLLQLDVDPHLVASDTNILVPVSEVQNVSTNILAANDSNGSVAFKRGGANSGWVIDLLMLCRQVRIIYDLCIRPVKMAGLAQPEAAASP